MNRIIRYIICFLVGVIFFVLLHNINTLDIVFPTEKSSLCNENPTYVNARSPPKYFIDYNAYKHGNIFQDPFQNQVCTLYDGHDASCTRPPHPVSANEHCKIFLADVFTQHDLYRADRPNGFLPSTCVTNNLKMFATVIDYSQLHGTSPDQYENYIRRNKSGNLFKYQLYLFNPKYNYEFNPNTGNLKMVNHHTQEIRPDSEQTGSSIRKETPYIMDYAIPRIDFLVREDPHTSIEKIKLKLGIKYKLILEVLPLLQPAETVTYQDFLTSKNRSLLPFEYVKATVFLLIKLGIVPPRNQWGSKTAENFIEEMIAASSSSFREIFDDANAIRAKGIVEITDDLINGDQPNDSVYGPQLFKSIPLITKSGPRIGWFNWEKKWIYILYTPEIYMFLSTLKLYNKEINENNIWNMSENTYDETKLRRLFDNDSTARTTLSQTIPLSRKYEPPILDENYDQWDQAQDWSSINLTDRLPDGSLYIAQSETYKKMKISHLFHDYITQYYTGKNILGNLGIDRSLILQESNYINYRLAPAYEIFDINYQTKNSNPTLNDVHLKPIYKLEYTDWASMIRVYSLMLYKKWEAQRGEVPESAILRDIPHPILHSQQHGFAYPDDIEDEFEPPPGIRQGRGREFNLQRDYEPYPDTSQNDASRKIADTNELGGYVRIRKLTPRTAEEGCVTFYKVNKFRLKQENLIIPGTEQVQLSPIIDESVENITSVQWNGGSSISKEQSVANYINVKRNFNHDEVDLENIEVIGFIESGTNNSEFEDATKPFGLLPGIGLDTSAQLRILYRDEDTNKLYSYGYHPNPIKARKMQKLMRLFGLTCINAVDTSNMNSKDRVENEEILILFTHHGKQSAGLNTLHTFNILPCCPSPIMDGNLFFEYIKSEIHKCPWWTRAATIINPNDIPLQLYLSACVGDKPKESGEMVKLIIKLKAAINNPQLFPDDTQMMDLEPEPEKQTQETETPVLGTNLKNIRSVRDNCKKKVKHLNIKKKDLIKIAVNNNELPKIETKLEIIDETILLKILHTVTYSNLIRYIEKIISNKIEQKKCKVNDNLSSGTPVYVDPNVISTEQRDMEGILNPDIQNTGIGGALLPTVFSGFR